MQEVTGHMQGMGMEKNRIYKVLGVKRSSCESGPQNASSAAGRRSAPLIYLRLAANPRMGVEVSAGCSVASGWTGGGESAANPIESGQEAPLGKDNSLENEREDRWESSMAGEERFPRTQRPSQPVTHGSNSSKPGCRRQMAPAAET